MIKLRMKRLLPTTYYLLPTRRGQAALSTVLLIGGIIVLIGMSIAFLASSFLNSSQGYRQAQRAQAVVISGVEDALMQLARNKDFASTGYSLAVGSSTASVSVTQDSPSTGQVTVVASSSVSSYQRTARVVISRNASTSQITVVSWTET